MPSALVQVDDCLSCYKNVTSTLHISYENPSPGIRNTLISSFVGNSSSANVARATARNLDIVLLRKENFCDTVRSTNLGPNWIRATEKI